MISVVDPAAEPGVDLDRQVEMIFSPGGLLSGARNFEFRPQQQAMAVAVIRALLRREHLAVEAGTGVGKSLAYLIPAILYGVAHKKTAVVSTHTINLQEQLTEKDLPMLARVLPVRFKFAMLKGRQNYLCTRRLRRALLQADSLFTSTETEELRRIAEWAATTEDGSLSDFEVEPDPRVWQQVCSERGLCSPKRCGAGSDFGREHSPCFFQRARSRILAADVVVLNHTLFFTLLGGLDEELTEGGVLFKNDFIIFDEAHHVESVASRHIGLSVSNAQLRYTLHRLWNPTTEKGLLATLRKAGAVPLVSGLLGEVERFFGAVESACDSLHRQGAKVEARDGESGSDEGRARRSWSELRVRRPELVPDGLTGPIVRLREAVTQLIQGSEDSDAGQELAECNRRLAELQEGVGAFLNQAERDYVYWVERAGRAQRNLSLNASPVDIADYLRRRLFGADTSILMTSATLSTTGGEGEPPAARAARDPESASAPVVPRRRAGLDYFVGRIGAEAAARLQVGSPFEYEKQVRVYVVRRMPDPREPGYRDAVAHWVKHFVRQTQGKAFVLFTSYRLMLEVSKLMEPFFEETGLQCFVQGTGLPRSTMLERFKRDVDSVLFGTDSFWQGVDVPGEALSNVIITRLPFAVPDHPWIEARVEAIEARGGNAFMEFSLPEAILKFRQGFGRLVRTRTDSGIVVVLDNRVLTKRYGQAFLDALPRCPVEVV